MSKRVVAGKKAGRKSGTLLQRRRHARKLARDRKIYRLLRILKARSVGMHRLLRAEIEPLSVYGGKTLDEHRHGDKLTRFPVRFQENGLPMPHWDDLTEWLKVQIAVMAMDNWELLTFSIHVHPDLESLWVGGGRDVRAMIRDRLRKEFEKDLRPGLEHFFVVEGWSKRDKKEVRLHFHGAALIDNPGAVAMIKAAAARAGGHDQAGRKKSHRAVHAARFTREGPRYINYLFKAARRHDDRLAKRRLTMSRSLVGATRSFWEMITDQPRLGHIAWLSSVAD